MPHGSIVKSSKVSVFIGALSTVFGSQRSHGLLLGDGWLPGRATCLQDWVHREDVARASTPASGTLGGFSPRAAENQQSPARTSSSLFWLTGSVQEAHQGPLPTQKLLVGTCLCNGPIFQHHNPIGLGQDVQRVGHENPCLGGKRWKLHSCLDQSSKSGWEGTGSVLGLRAGTAPLLVALPSFSKTACPKRDVEIWFFQTVSPNKKTRSSPDPVP